MVDPAIQGHTCVACGAPAVLACPTCHDEFYCSERHITEPYRTEKHDLICAWNVREAERERARAAGRCDSPEAAGPPVVQASPLLALGNGLLFQLCRYLPPRDLMRLGLVCRVLRAVCRDPRAWAHVTLTPGYSHDYRSKEKGLLDLLVLKIAPAVHTMRVAYEWPAVNLSRYTNEAKVLEIEFEDATGELVEDYDKKRLFHTIHHYRNSLEVVKLSCLHEMEVLHLIDRMPRVRELYIEGNLVKVYPGSSKVVSSLKLGRTVSGAVVGELIRANRATLESFSVDMYRSDRNQWLHYDGSDPKSPLWKELTKCKGLKRMSLTPPITLINSFPQLRSFSIHEFGDEKHISVKRIFSKSPVLKKLEKLSLGMGYHGHRGLLQIVGSNCTAVRELAILFRSSGRMDFVNVHVDVPRDLHVILGSMSNLQKLTLSVARVPSTVLDGIAQGALPKLTHLKLNSCGVTSKGREALTRLRDQRSGLEVDAKVSKAHTEHDSVWDWIPPRCEQAMCQAPSECDEDDPVSEADSDADSDAGSSGGFPSTDSTFFDDFACVDSDSD
ncbi:uncharacterized protein LOC113204138 [Frankliniella occidentalis]|uniref:Uncharacterized protein LOC113204138 n=1 Tax=Frankliniella occidentalis TaxID=133901 RepID=A0A6J1S8A8_FRAOC|nr:uncharacterized protein LOC113204138 [Frankliniella occidentalis]